MTLKSWKRVFGQQYSVIDVKPKTVLNRYDFQVMEKGRQSSLNKPWHLCYGMARVQTFIPLCLSSYIVFPD